MSPLVKSIVCSLGLVMLLGVLSACGQKGDLYLPPSPETHEQRQDEEKPQ